MNKLTVARKLEATFSSFASCAIDDDLFKRFGVRPGHPQPIAHVLQDISFSLQEIALFLESYPDCPLRRRTRKAIVKLQRKLAIDLNQLNFLLSEFFKPQNACCHLSAKLNDPLTGKACDADLRRLLSRVLDF